MSDAKYTPPWERPETLLYRDLLRACAEVLREDTEACRGFHLRHKTCKICAPLRDLLKRVEAVI